MVQAKATMERIGMNLIEEKRRAVLADMDIKKRLGTRKDDVAIDGDKTADRDILSVLSESSHTGISHHN